MVVVVVALAAVVVVVDVDEGEKEDEGAWEEVVEEEAEAEADADGPSTKRLMDCAAPLVPDWMFSPSCAAWWRACVVISDSEIWCFFS